MFKNFTLLLLLSISLPTNAADTENDRNEKPQVKSSKYKLSRHPQKPCPTDEDIQSYENIYGNIHPEVKKFYQGYGNCIKDDLDLIDIYGGAASRLGKETKLIQRSLPGYHAFAFDQAAGGYWVYQFVSPLVFELYDTGTLTKGKSIKGLLALLSKLPEEKSL